MKNYKFFLLAAVASLLCTLPVAATEVGKVESRIRTGLSKTLKPETIDAVRFTGRAALYEIVTPNGIFYTDQFGSFLIVGGELVDTSTGVNFTKKTLLELSKFKYSELPFHDAIKTVKGNGKRSFVTFEDPNCLYCKKLNSEIKKLDNVTVYTFVVSILSPDSQRVGRNVLCANSPSKAWEAHMSGEKLRDIEAEKCSDILSRNIALYKKLYLSGTPSLLFQNNSIVPGLITSDKLEAKILEN